MQDLFAPDGGCPICGHPRCWEHAVADQMPPEAFQLPHARDVERAPHVIAPEDVYSEPGPYGGSQRLVTKGEALTPEKAARFGWHAGDVVPLTGPGLPAPKRRRAPAPRVTVD